MIEGEESADKLRQKGTLFSGVFGARTHVQVAKDLAAQGAVVDSPRSMNMLIRLWGLIAQNPSASTLANDQRERNSKGQ